MAEDGDYGDAFTVRVGRGDGRSAEAWMREVFERAPAPVRAFLLVGWRAVLGLRLGPRPSPDHVLGWTIAEREDGAVRLRLESALMTARLTLRLDGGAAHWATSVSYRRGSGRVLWAVVAPIHRLMVPYLLKRAARVSLITPVDGQ
ncbi:DUF2867 domain-containing protein [Actinomadura verrucosospora]|uniref:DUF2867 domain-containing protein n=1 Tax=Actinomadura verrucosospora TaxID=46165 RepID=A0A7D3ZV45_ACTVE|nr:DUF2867 domain-containing protein [Actinomadura verrucosospora]QKG19566.1 hypothetical protein ACTIVE_1202 [Actinomadura verrucosospora]